MRTIGISPKVLAVIAALGGPGIVLLVIALATGDTELRNLALTVLAAGGVGGSAAAQASPGVVVPRTDVEDPTVDLGTPPAGL